MALNEKFPKMALVVNETSMATGEAAQAIQNLNEAFMQPIMISNPYKDLDVINNKQWVCKGKHQYRQINVNSEWICQCGKQLILKSK